MSYAIPVVGFPIRAILTALRKKCPTCSISLDMVCCEVQSVRIQLIILSELSIAPEMNDRLVPPHARKALKSKGIDIDDFVPMTKDEMIARLD